MEATVLNGSATSAHDTAATSETIPSATASLLPGFVFQTEYYQVIASVAATNRVDDWPLLRNIMKYTLAESIKGYLSLGPPFPLAPEAAVEAQSRAFESFDSFHPHPPFTVQRLAELILNPRQHYSTLPKYLRALTRAISVTSDQTAFTEDDSTLPFASTSRIEVGDATAGMGLMPTNTQTTPTRRPAILTRTSSSSSTSSTSSTRNDIPLLSPIPWLNHNYTADEFAPYENGIGTIRPSNGSPETRLLPQLTSISPTGSTNTPTGGVVDELDLGTGDGQIGEPVSLTHLAAIGGDGNGGSSLSPPRAVEEESRSLAERFERARSPRVEDEAEVQHFGMDP